MNFKTPLFAFLLITLLFSACKDDEMSGSDPCANDFDQKAMFTNLANNLIIPSFLLFQEEVNALDQAGQQFTENPNITNYQSLTEELKNAWSKWQSVAQYSFGPAETVFLRNSVNNFPLDLAETESKILAENYDFSSPDAYDKGFPALDYLVAGLADGSAEQVVDFYTSNDNAAKYKEYLRRVIADIKSRTDEVVAKWQGDYATTFINTTGTAAGTSLSLIINGLNHNYELIKREKVGVPSGVLTLGFPNPENVEARFTANSALLTDIALKATQSLYTGTGVDGTNGLGLDDFLTEIEAKKGSQNLNDVILAQFEAANNAVSALSDPLSTQVQEDQETVENAYKEITKNVVNLKTDMPSVLCVSITYIDNPSDSD